MNELQLGIFDYDALDSDTRTFVEIRTVEIKSLVRRSAQDIISIGEKLDDVKQRLGHGKYVAWLGVEFEWSIATAERFVRVAKRFKNRQIDDFAPSALYLLSAPSTPDAAVEEAFAIVENGERVTHATAKEIVSRLTTPVVAPLQDIEDEPTDKAGVSSKMAVHYSSDTPEHYTPEEIVDAVVDCLGAIDLDPCSNSHDDPNVPATLHYTENDNGLSQEWHGRVFMNPPYGREIGKWIDKLRSEYDAGNVSEAIALVPARTDTDWFDRLIEGYRLQCFVHGRLVFVGNDNSAPFPSAIVYLGDNDRTFFDTFGIFGRIVQELHPEMIIGEP